MQSFKMALKVFLKTLVNLEGFAIFLLSYNDVVTVKGKELL
jgi:hypothetical protein